MASRKLQLVSVLAMLLAAAAPSIAAAAPDSMASATKPAPAVATKEAEDREVDQWNKGLPKASPAQDDSMADRASKTYGVARESVLKEKKAGKRSWSQVSMAHEIAKRANRPVDEVWAQRDKGQGWGQIAHSYGMNVGDVKKSAKRNVEAWGGSPKGKSKPGAPTAASKGKQGEHGKQGESGEDVHAGSKSAAHPDSARAEGESAEKPEPATHGSGGHGKGGSKPK